MIAARILGAIAGFVLVMTTGLSAIKTVVVPRATTQRLSRGWFVAFRHMFEFVAHPRRSFERRDQVLALYAPVALVLLPALWVTLVIIGFTGMQWAVSGQSLRTAFLVSGSSLLTLGVRFNAALPSAVLSFFEATIGLGLVAMLISYLPSIYSAFGRREALVGMLESRAGTPPSPYELLVRYRRIGALQELDDDLFRQWEPWFIDVEETHTSFPALAFFRSPQPERNWVTAAGCVLDTSALYLSIVDRHAISGDVGRVSLCLRTGYLALRRIASAFGIQFDADPSPTDPISVTRREFDLMCFELDAADVPMVTDRDQAWLDFQGWRVNYDTVLLALAKLVLAPEGRWSSDRPGPRLVPSAVAGRRAVRSRRPSSRG